MTHKLDADDFFIHRVQQHCAERGLNFFLIEPVWVEAFFEKFQRGKIWPRVLLNMHSEHHQPDDIFHRLINLAHERETQVIDPPDRALAAFNKALLHPRLESAGLPVPPTIVVPREAAETFTLSPAQRELLGSPFVIKPAMGYGRGGVILDATSENDLTRSLGAWPDAQYLLQKKITPCWLDERPAYFRVYYVFGSLWFCWWNCYTDQYRLVTPAEMEAYQLAPLREIICRLAALTQMQFFSTEVALTEAREFVLIDYVNDQCHLVTQSAHPVIGVPDELVAGIARALVEAAHRMIQTAP